LINSLKVLSHFFVSMEKIFNLMNKICEPSANLITDNIQRKLQSRRNKSNFFTQTLVLLSLLLYLQLLPGRLNSGQLIFVAGYLLNLVLFCLFCRSFPIVPKIYYGLMTVILGPLSLYLNPDGVFGCWICIFIHPTLMMLFFESSWPGFLELTTQLFFMFKVYIPVMQDVFNHATASNFVNRLAFITSYTVIINTIVVYMIGLSLKNAYIKDLLTAEHKRKELERQKIFLLSFSPELRNIIHTIAGTIQLSLLDNLSDQVRGYLENAEAGASMLLQLINNILDTGKMEIGELEMNPTPITVQKTLERIWSLCSCLLSAKDLRGELRVSRSIPKTLQIDQYRLMQIMLNLIGNSVKYTQKGSINISIEWIKDCRVVQDCHFLPHPFDEENEGVFEKQQAMSNLNSGLMIFRMRKKGLSHVDGQNDSDIIHPGILKISVTDTGCGIPPDQLPNKIFEKSVDPGANDDPEMQKKYTTTLGLFITRELCSRMGGDIRAYSKIGKGTSFIICVPATPVSKASNSAVVDLRVLKEMAQWHKFKVMVVDDLNFNVVILQNYFQKMDITVQEVAKDGYEAYLKYIKGAADRCRFDIVTLDVDMPRMSGKEAAKKIRQYEKKHDLKPCLLIMVSGNCSESDIGECLDKNGDIRADYFLKKPATFDDLFLVLSQHLSNDLLHLDSKV